MGSCSEYRRDAGYRATLLIYEGILTVGHEVLQRYQQINAQWKNTADSGAITLSVQDGSWAVQSLRDTDGKYWNNK
jgi:hypothetical protein